MTETLEQTRPQTETLTRAESLLETVKPMQPKLVYNKQALLKVYKDNLTKTQGNNPAQALANSLKALARFTGGPKETFTDLESQFLAALQQSEEQLTVAYRDYCDSLKQIRDMLAASIKGYKDRAQENPASWQAHLEQVVEQTVVRFHKAESMLSSNHRMQANFVAGQINTPLVRAAQPA